eukprot:s45_g16.t1
MFPGKKQSDIDISPPKTHIFKWSVVEHSSSVVWESGLSLCGSSQPALLSVARTQPGTGQHVTMAQGHHLLEGAIANASPEASQGIPTPTPSTLTAGGEIAGASQLGGAAIAAAAHKVVPLSKVQAIFSERKDDLNLALDEMKDKVTSLMHGVPGAHGSHSHGGQGHGGHGHTAASALPHGRSAGNVKASAAPSEFTEVREHACWLWSRLGVSLMTLEDRNVWLEDENKRLEQELEGLETQIREARQLLKSHGRVPPPLDTSEEVVGPQMDATGCQTTPSQSMTASPSQRAAPGPGPTGAAGAAGTLQPRSGHSTALGAKPGASG